MTLIPVHIVVLAAGAAAASAPSAARPPSGCSRSAAARSPSASSRRSPAPATPSRRSASSSATPPTSIDAAARPRAPRRSASSRTPSSPSSTTGGRSCARCASCPRTGPVVDHQRRPASPTPTRSSLPHRTPPTRRRRGALAVDLERRLTDESMKVAPAAERHADAHRQGRHRRAGRRVRRDAGGARRGPARACATRSRRSSTVPEAVNEWYEGAVGRTAADGVAWRSGRCRAAAGSRSTTTATSTPPTRWCGPREPADVPIDRHPAASCTSATARLRDVGPLLGRARASTSPASSSARPRAPRGRSPTACPGLRAHGVDVVECTLLAGRLEQAAAAAATIIRGRDRRRRRRRRPGDRPDQARRGTHRDRASSASRRRSPTTASARRSPRSSAATACARATPPDAVRDHRRRRGRSAPRRAATIRAGCRRPRQQPDRVPGLAPCRPRGHDRYDAFSR